VVAIRVLALDLERTLISDAGRAEPRPGLVAFLAFCHERFERVVLFTTVDEPDARAALDELVQRHGVPEAFVDQLEYVQWCGEHKGLEFVTGAEPEEVILVDDDEGWIRPAERAQWIAIAPWDGGPDRELPRVQQLLAAHLAAAERQ
jgi:FMN phosphatase YigB (HAD superfamily)